MGQTDTGLKAIYELCELGNVVNVASCEFCTVGNTCRSIYVE